MAVSANDLVVGPLTPAVGVTTISLDFYFEDAAWLQVYKGSSDTPLVLDTDYTVTGEGTVDGVVTLTVAANGTDAYSVYLVVPLQRSSDMQLRGEFKSGPFNLEMDRLWQALQGISTRLSRAIVLSRNSPVASAVVALTTAGRAGRAIIFSSDGTGLEAGPVATDIENAQANAAAAAASAEAAATSAAAAATFDPDLYQPINPALTSLAALGTAANKGVYATGEDTFAEFDLTAAARGLLDDADVAAMRATLELGSAALMADSADADFDTAPDAAARRDLVKSYVDGRIVLETALTTSGAAEYGFTGIAAGAKRITLMLSEVSLSGTDNILVQIGDADGYEVLNYIGTSVINDGSGNAMANETAGFRIPVAVAASAVSGKITLTRFDASAWAADGHVARPAATQLSSVAGVKALSAALDRVRIKSSGSDTFDGGTVNVLVEY